MSKPSSYFTERNEWAGRVSVCVCVLARRRVQLTSCLISDDIIRLLHTHHASCRSRPILSYNFTLLYCCKESSSALSLRLPSAQRPPDGTRHSARPPNNTVDTSHRVNYTCTQFPKYCHERNFTTNNTPCIKFKVLFLRARKL